MSLNGKTDNFTGIKIGKGDLEHDSSLWDGRAFEIEPYIARMNCCWKEALVEFEKNGNKRGLFAINTSVL